MKKSEAHPTLDPSASPYGASSASIGEAASFSGPSTSHAANVPSRPGKRKRSQDNEHQLTDHPHAKTLLDLLNASAKWSANQSPTRSLYDENLCLELANGTTTPIQSFYQTLAPHLPLPFTRDGFTPLMAICACDIDLRNDTVNTQGYKLLFQRIINDSNTQAQASLSQGKYKGATALGWACYYHHDQLIPDLLKAGASIDKNMCPVFLSCLLHPKKATTHAYQTLITIILSLPQEQTKLVANLATQTLQEQPLEGDACTRTKTLLDILAKTLPVCMMPQDKGKTTQVSAIYFQVLADLYEHQQKDAYPAWKALIQPYMEALISTYQPSILLNAVARDTCFRPAWMRFLVEALCNHYHSIDKLASLIHALSALESKLDRDYHLPTLGYYHLLRHYLQRYNPIHRTTDLSAVTPQAFFHLQPTDSTNNASPASRIMHQVGLTVLNAHYQRWSSDASSNETGIRKALRQNNAFIYDQGQKRLKDEIIRSCKLPAIYALLPESIYRNYPNILAPYYFYRKHQRTCQSMKIKVHPFQPRHLHALFAQMHARVREQQITPQDIRKSTEYATAVSIIREVFDAMVEHSELRDRIDDARSDDMHTTYIPSDMIITLGLPLYFTLVPLSIAYRASWILGEQNWQNKFTERHSQKARCIRTYFPLMSRSTFMDSPTTLTPTSEKSLLVINTVMQFTSHLFSCLNHPQDHTIYQLAKRYPDEINNLCTFSVIFNRSDVCRLIILIHHTLLITSVDQAPPPLHQANQTQEAPSFRQELAKLTNNDYTRSVLAILQGHRFKKPLLFLVKRACELQHLVTGGEEQPFTLRTMIGQRFSFNDCLAYSLIPNTFYRINWEAVCISPALQARYRAIAERCTEHQAQASSSASSTNIDMLINRDRLVLQQEIIDIYQHLGNAKQLSENERKEPLHKLCVEILCEARARYRNDHAYRNKLQQVYSEHQAMHTTIPEQTIRELQLPEHLAYIPLDMLWLPDDLHDIYTQKATLWIKENGNRSTDQTHYLSDQLHGLRRNITQCFERIYTEGHRITDQEKKLPVYQTCQHIMNDILSKKDNTRDEIYTDQLQQAYVTTQRNLTCLAPDALHKAQLDDYLCCVPIDILRNYLELPLSLNSTIILD